MTRFEGFLPVFSEESRVLILGSFPSVKSREAGFYYGNPRNRFWETLCSFFGEEIPPTVEEKTAFLLKYDVALWDMVASCEIVGSADAAIKGEHVVDVGDILRHAPVDMVLCNGAKAYELFLAQYAGAVRVRKMPSTSPANPRFRKEIWHAALAEIFPEKIVFRKSIDKSAAMR